MVQYVPWFWGHGLVQQGKQKNVHNIFVIYFEKCKRSAVAHWQKFYILSKDKTNNKNY